jgi:TonB-dependent SusC/RagA subfamily outer membrane receptor
MRLSLLPAALSIWVIVGLAADCASGNARREAPGTPTLTSEDIERNSGEPIERLLEAKVPGLMVTRTADGAIAVQIRGPSSFYGNGAPLYVIDDVPIQPGPGGVLRGISPHDIESIKVLTNPADTAIYGLRGGNGVIVITTKRPGKRSDPSATPDA